MGNVQSQTVTYLPANRFRISVDGQSYGEFEEAEDFDSFEIGVMEIHTGESNVVASQSAGKKKCNPLKLTKGAVKADKDYLRQWTDRVVDASGQNGDVDPQYKKIVTLDQLDRDGTPVMTWTMYEAWPSKYNGGKFDAKANEYRRVSVEITFRRNEVGPAQL